MSRTRIKRYVDFALSMTLTAKSERTLQEEERMLANFACESHEFFEGVQPWDDLDPTELKLDGIDPWRPTDAPPGSDQKVLMLAARYAAGVPLWHDADRATHDPVNGSDGSGLPLDPFDSEWESDIIEDVFDAADDPAGVLSL